MKLRIHGLPTLLLSFGLLFVACGASESEDATLTDEVADEEEATQPTSTSGHAEGTQDPQAEQAYGPADGATFEILRVEVLDKSSSLEGVERHDFSLLSEEDWEGLPKLLQIEFEFVPTHGNTEDLEDTFLLTPQDMAVLVEGRDFPSIGSISRFGNRELSQRIPFNVAGEEYPDGTLDYCGMGCPQSTMWFLVPASTTELELAYRGTPVARGTATEVPAVGGDGDEQARHEGDSE